MNERDSSFKKSRILERDLRRPDRGWVTTYFQARLDVQAVGVEHRQTSDKEREENAVLQRESKEPGLFAHRQAGCRCGDSSAIGGQTREDTKGEVLGRAA